MWSTTGLPISLLLTLSCFACSDPLDSPRLALAATLLGGTDAAFGQNKVAEHFTKEIEQGFMKSSRKSYAMRVAAKRGKPLIVLLTKRVRWGHRAVHEPAWMPARPIVKSQCAGW